MTQEFNTLSDLMAWMKEEVREKGLTYYQVCDLSTNFMHIVSDTEELHRESSETYEAGWYWIIRENGTGLFSWSSKRDQYRETYKSSILKEYVILYRNGTYLTIAE